MRCMRATLRHMYERGSGVIVNNASVLGWRAQAGQAHYAAAKAGVMALTRCARSEEHTSELQSLMRSSYAVFCLKKKKQQHAHSRLHQYTTHRIMLCRPCA